MTGEGQRRRVIGIRDLNRALLARQMLLQRAPISALEAIERLCGMQSQTPNAPYFGLWTRLEGFRQEQLSQLLQDRQVVRIALMRSTIHLVSSNDCLELRPWLQSALDRSLKAAFGKRLAGVDLVRLAEAGRKLVEEKPMTFKELGSRLRAEWPEHAPEALAAAVRNAVPLVQTPPRGLWGNSGQSTHTSVEAWLNQPLNLQYSSEKMIKRYLAAFGPATIQDIEAWSGLTRIRKEIEYMRHQLVTYQDEQGAELFDLPDTPLPESDMEPPARFLGEYDNILLSHANRNRIMDEVTRKRVITSNGIVHSTILLDGFVAGKWKHRQDKGNSALIIQPFRRLTQREQIALSEEGERLLEFSTSTASREIVFEPAL
ncbi:winged helix DNA-binding domain-containing protein [Paenibacillus albiflavus]|uniref:Winged helix DNA-binding domain-containing protein n=2 Tax=Paenibacillus albiflavus TaxID=2545760 RepID=A0A4R4E4K7_9BACL|nr:winged helix DNA-binding domain-containing protein [Paenibacillus albiflavus]